MNPTRPHRQPTAPASVNRNVRRCTPEARQTRHLIDGAEGVTDEWIATIRHRDLSHVTTAWMEIAASPLDDGPSDLAVVSAASFADDHAEPLTLALGDTNDSAFWFGFFHDLRARGLRDVKVVVGREFRGLAKAVAAVFPTAGVVTWKSLDAVISENHHGDLDGSACSQPDLAPPSRRARRAR